MAGNRIYVTQFNVTQITTAKNSIWYLKAGTANGIELHSVSLSCGTTSPVSARINLTRLGSTFTAPTGNTTAFTVYSLDSGDTKASTLAANFYLADSKATVNTGTLQILESWEWQMMGEFLYLPPPEDRPVCAASEAFEMAFNAALGATSTTAACTIKWREFP